MRNFILILKLYTLLIAKHIYYIIFIKYYQFMYNFSLISKLFFHHSHGDADEYEYGGASISKIICSSR